MKITYYISSGEKNAMRTLRCQSVGFKFFRDSYECNLSRDHDTAVSKARNIIGQEATLISEDFDLNNWGENVQSKLNPWEIRNIAIANAGMMPFGKHKMERMIELPTSYIRFWVESSASNAVGTVIIHNITRIANDLDLFSKWEKEDVEKEQRKNETIEAEKSLVYVGEVGKREEFEVTCKHVLTFHGNYGATFFNICKDKDANVVIYKGTNRWEKNTKYKVMGTVKTHKEYKNVKQTFISRPTIKERTAI